jgi:hypothetical protein
MRGFLWGLLLALFAFPAYAASGPVLQVSFSNPRLTPSQWTLTLYPDGRGHFRSVEGSAQAADPPMIEAPGINRDIQLTPEFAQKAFATVHRSDFFTRDCESHLKVAFQGWKTITYSGPDGEGTCRFNYSKHKEIQELGDSFISVAATIVEGERLEMLWRHDPLGLDREMEYITEAVADGRLLQIVAIRGILEQLAQDPAVMERVRKRSSLLLSRMQR